MSVFSITLIVSVLILLPVVSRIYLLDSKNPLHRSIVIAGFLVGLLGILEYEMTHVTSIEDIEYLALFHSSLTMAILYFGCAAAYYFTSPFSVFLEKTGRIVGAIMIVPLLFTYYLLFIKGEIIDMNHEIIDGKWRYNVNKKGLAPFLFMSWFVVLELFLCISHFIAYWNAKDKRQRRLKFILFLTFTLIPLYLIYQFIFAPNLVDKGDYSLSPYLAILIIILGWVYTNFKLFEISPVAALDNILESMSNVIIITDNDFKIKYVNEAFEKIGIKRKHFLGKSIITLAQKTGKIPPENFDLIRQLKHNEKRERTITFDFKGHIVHFLTTVLPTFNQQKTKIGYVFVLTDLTETVETRNQIKQYASELEQSNKELERFAYIASHDMKTPLRNIVSFINLLQRRLKNHEDNEVHEFLEFASSNARYMHSLVQDILEFSMIYKSENKVKTLNTNEVVANVINNLQDYIKERNAVIKYENLPIIIANSTQIHQLFQNLIENGIKYNESEQPQVKIYAKQTNHHLIITFEDNGIGIPKEFQKQIFEMFKRLHNNTNYQGTGIGLAICDKIVNLHQGKIQVTSNGVQGSQFIITFPIAITAQKLLKKVG